GNNAWGSACQSFGRCSLWAWHMSCNKLRAIWTLLLLMMVCKFLATVGNKTQMSTSLDREKFTNKVAHVIAAHRFNVEPMLQQRDQFPDATLFQAPGCDQPIEIIPVHINLQDAPLFNAHIKANHTRQFAYLDQTWRSENRVEMRIAWLKHKVLSFL